MTIRYHTRTHIFQMELPDGASGFVSMALMPLWVVIIASCSPHPRPVTTSIAAE